MNYISLFSFNFGKVLPFVGSAFFVHGGKQQAEEEDKHEAII
ncbi:hypothetical protein [Ammoniphilus sp. 3BR4]